MTWHLAAPCLVRTGLYAPAACRPRTCVWRVCGALAHALAGATWGIEKSAIAGPDANRSTSLSRSLQRCSVATSIHRQIARELNVKEPQVEAAIALLDGGATVPFIARYRKEATGSLDDAQLRTLEERLRYLRELEDRRTAILESIESQGKLDDALRAQIMGADTKARLEDIYLPYKPKRRTKAQIARENGLEPLADLLPNAPENDPHRAAANYLS